MADRLFKIPLRALDASGDGVAGAKVYLYESGTSTPVTAYTDSGAGTAHPTPLVADGGGTFAELYVLGAAGIKVNVTDSAGASLDGFPVDPVFPESSTNTGAANVSFSPTTSVPESDVQAAIESVDAKAVALEASNTGTNTGDEVAATETVAGIAELATQAEAEAGTDDQAMMTALKTKQAIGASNQILHVVNHQVSGTAGATTVVGWLNTHQLNTVLTNEISGASLTTYLVTLPAGTYEVSGWAQAGGSFNSGVYRLKSRLYNVTDSATAIVGGGNNGPGYAGDSLTTSPNLPFEGKITIAATKVFRVEVYTNDSSAEMGMPMTSGEVEVYASVIFKKVG